MFAYTGVTLTTRTVSFLGTVSEAVRIRSNTHPDIRDTIALFVATTIPADQQHITGRRHTPRTAV